VGESKKKGEDNGKKKKKKSRRKKIQSWRLTEPGRRRRSQVRERLVIWSVKKTEKKEKVVVKG